MKSMKSFFSKKSILGTMAVAAVCMLGTGNAQAQEFTIQEMCIRDRICTGWVYTFSGLLIRKLETENRNIVVIT